MKITYILPFTCDAGILSDGGPLYWTRKMLHNWKAYDATHGAGDQWYYDTLIRLHADPDFNKWCINNLPVIPR